MWIRWCCSPGKSLWLQSRLQKHESGAICFSTCIPILTRKRITNSNVQCKPRGSGIKDKMCWQRKRRDTPRPVSSGTCERFRGAVLSSVGTWSSVTYRALVANAVITKQSCSRTTKKEIYKDKRAHKKSDGQGFPNLRSGSSVLGDAYWFSEAMFCQGTALFNVMTVLACLSSQSTGTTPAPTCGRTTNHSP